MSIQDYTNTVDSFDLKHRQYQIKADQRTRDDFPSEKEYIDYLIDLDEETGAGAAYAEAKRQHQEVFGDD